VRFREIRKDIEDLKKKMLDKDGMNNLIEDQRLARAFAAA
jgi:DNA-binding HxlR family transcriptional regulator